MKTDKQGGKYMCQVFKKIDGKTVLVGSVKKTTIKPASHSGMTKIERQSSRPSRKTIRLTSRQIAGIRR